MMQSTIHATAPREPAKLVIERRIEPGASERFESWIHRLITSFNETSDLEGSSVSRPSAGTVIRPR